MLASFSSAQWRLLSESYLGNVYLDFSKSEKKEPYYFVWQLQDFNEDKRGVKSRRIPIKLIVKLGAQNTYSASHSEHMGKGTVVLGGVASSAWTEPCQTVGANLFLKCAGSNYGEKGVGMRNFRSNFLIVLFF